MTMYKRKPLAIEAVQFTENNLKEVLVFLGKMPSVDYEFTSKEEMDAFENYKQHAFYNGIDIKIGDYILKARVGDYIVKENENNFIIIDKVRFEASFEEMTLDSLLTEERG
mgnify:CR=1 FL=1